MVVSEKYLQRAMLRELRQSDQRNGQNETADDAVSRYLSYAVPKSSSNVVCGHCPHCASNGESGHLNVGPELEAGSICGYRERAVGVGQTDQEEQRRGDH